MSQHRSCVCGTSDKKPYTIRGELYILCSECFNLQKAPRIYRVTFRANSKVPSRKKKIKEAIKVLGSLSVRSILVHPGAKNWVEDADLAKAKSVTIKYRET